jgi:hypothetical protein
MGLLQYFADAAVKIDANTINIPKDNANDILAGVLNGAYFAAGAVAVIVIILAGYSFTTTVYDPAKIAQAKNALIYSITGLLVVIIAFIATQFIIGRF